LKAYDKGLKSKEESTKEEGANKNFKQATKKAGKGVAVDEEKINPSLQAQEDAEEDKSADPKKTKETKSMMTGYGLGMLSTKVTGKSEPSREDLV